MAENKKSFLIYCDIINTIDHLTDEEKGKLFQHLLEYVNDMNPVMEDRVLLSSWKPIEQQLKRDLKKYEAICGRNSINGALGGRPKKPKKPSGLIDNPTKPKKADTDNDTDKDKDIKKQKFLIFWELYPKKVNRKQSLEKWLKLTDKEIDEIAKSIKYFIAYKPFEDYTHPNPTTYFNQKRWEDVISKEDIKIEVKQTAGDPTTW